MSAGTGALTLPRRGPHSATRRLLEIALVLAVGLGTIGALAAVREPAEPMLAPDITGQDAPTHGRHAGAGRVSDDDLMTHGRHAGSGRVSDDDLAHGRHGDAPTRAADR